MHTILSVCKVMFASVSIKHNEQYKNKTIISKKQIHFLKWNVWKDQYKFNPEHLFPISLKICGFNFMEIMNKYLTELSSIIYISCKHKLTTWPTS